jgi:hypothetical protein
MSSNQGKNWIKYKQGEQWWDRQMQNARQHKQRQRETKERGNEVLASNLSKISMAQAYLMQRYWLAISLR